MKRAGGSSWHGLHAVCGWALLLGCLALVSAPVWADDDSISARAYAVRHRALTEAAHLVEPLLSEDGTITLRPKLRTIVVEDRKAVLDRVQALLESFDLPPQSVEMTLTLFLGSDRNRASGAVVPASGVMSKEVRGVIETLGDFTRWTAYEPLGSRSVTGIEGSEIVTHLSDDYRVVFTVDFVQEVQGTVTLRRLALQRLKRDDDGVESFENLYAAGMVLPIGKLHVVGAASGPDSKRALFLMLQAETR